MKDGRNAFNILTDKPTGKRTLQRRKYRWEYNIRMDLKEIQGFGLIQLRIGIIGKPF